MQNLTGGGRVESYKRCRSIHRGCREAPDGFRFNGYCTDIAKNVSMKYVYTCVYI